MYEVKIVVNGEEFPAHYTMLNRIANHFPNDSQYGPLAHALLGLNIPSITKELIGNDSLTMEDLDQIWAKGDLDARRELADNSGFRKNLTDAQAEEIIELNDVELLKNLARYAEEFYPAQEEKQAMRLSGKMADALLEFMASHKDSSVRQSLAENSQAPLKFRPSFANLVKDGLIEWSTDISGMTVEDVEALKGANLESLKTVANSVEDIEDKKARAKVIDFLCAWPDPAVRLELAENRCAPRRALLRLIDDPDFDVAQAARENMKDD